MKTPGLSRHLQELESPIPPSPLPPVEVVSPAPTTMEIGSSVANPCTPTESLGGGLDEKQFRAAGQTASRFVKKMKLRSLRNYLEGRLGALKADKSNRPSIRLEERTHEAIRILQSQLNRCLVLLRDLSEGFESDD